jgi:hypothetical protein
MYAFEKQIVVDGHQYAFHFHPVIYPYGNKYFVQINPDGRDAVSFEMKQQHPGKWVAIQPAPSWVTGIQDQLSDAIVETIKG